MAKLKKVLIVTYYWPPSAGGGVQRWLKFAKHLPAFGWEPIIYTPENPDYSLQDNSLLADVDSEMTVLKQRIWEPYSLLRLFTKQQSATNTGQVSSDTLIKKLASWVRGNLLIPDPRKFWIKPSVSFLKTYIRKNNVEYLITTGPPHSMHLIGYQLKRQLDIKWIVDIRDPWSRFDLLKHFYIMKFRQSKYAQLESAVLATCDKVIATSVSMQDQLVSFDKTKFAAITNGYDADDFSSVSDLSNPAKKVIYHAGLINAFRNPKNLWKALQILAQQDSKLAEQLVVKLVGSVDTEVTSYISQIPDLKFDFKLEPYKPHEKVLVDYQTSNFLLLLVNDSENAMVNIPGKAFEYLAAKKPIICVSQKDTDVWKILEPYNHVLLVEYLAPVNELVVSLGNFLEHVKVMPFDYQKYSRASLTGELADVLNSL